MHTEQELQALLEKYNNGQATPEEEIQLRAWLNETGRHQTVAGLTSEEKERMQLAFEGAVAPVVSISGTRRVFYKAAVAAVLIGFAATGWWLFSRHPTNTINEPVQFVEVKTGIGEIKEFTLPDSSHVWLNANAHLAYHPDFATHRTIKLEGEALFDVHKNDECPFSVTTSDSLHTLVLGTQFNIRSYKALAETQVTVLSGKVQVSHPSQTLLHQLTKDQSIRYNNKNRKEQQLAVNSAQTASWTKGDVNLQGEGVETFALLMHNWFGVDIKNKLPESAHLQLDANFNSKQNREEILQVFSILAACKYRWTNSSTVELYQ